MKKLFFLFSSVLATNPVLAQKIAEIAPGNIETLMPQTTAVIDTLLPPAAGDSCSTNPTFYTYQGSILSGAVDFGGASIERVGQLMNPAGDSMSIQQMIVLIVHKSAGSNTGSFQVSLYDTSDLSTPFASSLPVLFDQINDTSDVSILNDFHFTSPVSVRDPFYAVIEVENANDSIFLATTGDDCGGRSAIFQSQSSWFYYADEFGLGTNDPLDFALHIWAVADRPVGLEDFSPDSRLEVFPNPAIDQLQIKLQELEMEDLNFSIYNQQGQMLLQQSLEQFKGSAAVNTESLPSGTYFYSLKTDQKVYSGSFLKIK